MDDVFRNDEARRGLESLSPDLKVTIIATSRSNEMPHDLRSPFPIRVVELGTPTQTEKMRVLQRLGKSLATLETTKRQLLENANAWWVVMSEVTEGKEHTKVIHDNLKRLKQQDDVVYRAFEYLSFAGQFDLPVPVTLLQRLDSRGQFFNLLERPASKGIIFADDHLEGALRSLHPSWAREAVKSYNRDPLIMAHELFAVLQVSLRDHRHFLVNILRRALDQQPAFGMQLSQRGVDLIDAVLPACRPAELKYQWAVLYHALGEHQKVAEIEGLVLERVPENQIDWTASIKHAEQNGTPAQVAAVIENTAQWLTTNPQDASVRPAYLGLVERKGTPAQIATMIQDTAQWLTTNPQDASVHPAYLGLVERKGTPAQIATMIQDTAQWLTTNPQDTHVRERYLGLVERKGTFAQIAFALQNTAEWLADNPQNTNVRTAYLGLVERKGTPAQIATMIQDTAQWLADNLRDTNVRTAYLGLVERKGTPAQIATMIQDTAQWLTTNPQDTNVRERYLGVVERKGTFAQIAFALQSTAEWLADNPQDTNVRTAYLGLVERKGTPAQIATMIQDTARWLEKNLQSHILSPYLTLVATYGVVEDLEHAIELAERWKTSGQLVDFFVLNSYGRVLLKCEKYQDAEIQFRQALEKAKSYARARVGLAWSLYHQGKKGDALNELQHVKWWAQKMNKYPLGGALYQLGKYYLLEEKFDQAIPFFQKAIQASPERYGHYWSLGRAFLAEKQYRDALTAFESAREWLPDNINQKARDELNELIQSARFANEKERFNV